MKKLLFSVAAMATLFSATAQEAPAQEENEISVEMNVGYNSAYVWRGLNYINDAVLQSDITVGYKGFTFNIWANNNLTDESQPEVKTGEFYEVDYTLAYSGEATEDIDYTVGLVRYTYPEYHTAEYTTEVFAGLTFNDTFLNPEVTAYYDIDTYNGGIYIQSAVSHAVEIYKGQNLDLGAAVGLGDDKNNNLYYDNVIGGDTAQRSGFNFTDFALSASTDFSVNENMTLTPGLTYAKTFDGKNETLFGGINLNYVF